MQLSDFHFDLPEGLIARYPAEKRSQSRLLSVDSPDQLAHGRFADILHKLNPGDLLVFNNTKVIPARMFGSKATGGKVEIFVERIFDDRILAHVRASKTSKVGDILFMPLGVQFRILGRKEQFYELALASAGSVNSSQLMDIVFAIGQIPLPPYMQREVEESDKERYQTVYAKHPGSVAAPTAGFHFDEELLQQIAAKGVEMAYLNLQIGAGTYAPVRTENLAEHRMHAEYIDVSAELCEQMSAARKRGSRIIAVGTTTLRALETACKTGTMLPFKGETDIFILPGHTFHSVDALITNLHLPHSTLLMLVSAFGGYETMIKAYQAAVQEGYHFYSYGDAMWIQKETLTKG